MVQIKPSTNLTSSDTNYNKTKKKARLKTKKKIPRNFWIKKYEKIFFYKMWFESMFFGFFCGFERSRTTDNFKFFFGGI